VNAVATRFKYNVERLGIKVHPGGSGWNVRYVSGSDAPKARKSHSIIEQSSDFFPTIVQHFQAYQSELPACETN
jgi:hypothetical protein